jgi:hypothetical protein
MKFEDLKLPPTSSVDFVWRRSKAPDLAKTEGVVHLVAHWVYEQMHAHYEAKLVEANKRPQPAHEWRLPDPPPGEQWHRDDWTQDMLPEGYRPLLLGEKPENGDSWFSTGCSCWLDLTECTDIEIANKAWAHTRTRRPLPAPVEYVPLEPGDIQPGSVVRCIGATWWKQVTGVRAENITVCAAGNLSWQALADSWEILRPGSTTWEPCKKPKA